MSTSKSSLYQAFCLDGLFLRKIEVHETTIDLHVHSPRNSIICHRCGKTTKRVHKRVSRTLKHTRCDEKIVRLMLTVRDFRCKNCGRFREQIPGIDRRHTTSHYRKQLIPKARDRSFSSVAREGDVSASSFIRATTELMQSSQPSWPNNLFALGLDEHSFSGHDMMTTITNITDHKLLKILPDDKQITIARFLKTIPEPVKKNLFCVCTDMRQGFRSVVERCLPGIPLVVDKFHLIQHLNWHIGQLRSVYTSSKFPIKKKLLEKNKEDLTDYERAVLKIVFKRFPSLEEFWKMKEIVRKIYQTKNPETARRRFQDLLNGLEFDHRPRWQTLYKTLKRWQEPILNYFTYRVTNAYTEGVHTRIKLLKRISYGFRNKDNYITKMMLAFIPFVQLVSFMKHHLV